jgi:hypothetical protein
MTYHTHADIAARLRGLAEVADAIAKGSARADPRRAQAAGLRADLLTTARALDPHPNMRLVVSNGHLPGALDYAPDGPGAA